MLIALLFFWIILSGNFSLFFISAALFSSIISVFIIQKLFKKEKLILIKIVKKGFPFIFTLFKEIFISSWNVTKLIWFNSNEINQCYGWINVNSNNHDIQVIFANSITLTPGTMSLEIKDNKIKVHSLRLDYLEGLYKGNLNQSIIKLESD